MSSQGVGQNGPSPISRWYDNRSVFITGATGFMGKVLVEKLLSSCPNINNIYVLLRSKKDVPPERRLDQLKQSAAFDHLNRQCPSKMDKIIAIAGDVTLPDLGISLEDQKTLVANVSVVFHSAATVRFDEALRLSVSMNVLSTKRLLHLVRRMPKLEAFIHVSTAYCNCDLDIVDEVVYPPPGDIDSLLKCLDCLDDDLLQDMTPKLIGNRPNTYTFTKALAEHVLVKEGHGLPIAILRPSIVTASIKEPVPGWIDNVNGPTGIFIGAGKGILRTFLCKRSNRADIVPVDMCINAIIVAAWNTAKEKHQEIKVYNMASGDTNPIFWGDIEEYCRELLIKHPFNDILWYPGGGYKSTWYMNELYSIFLHTIPAYIFDFTIKFLGAKSNISLLRVQNKMKKALSVLEYFCNNQWLFTTKNIQELQCKMTPNDRRLFDFDVSSINWKIYVENYIKGIRLYVLKESEKDIPKAKNHLNRLFYVHIFTKLILGYLLWRISVGNMDIVKKFSYNIIQYTIHCIQKITALFVN